MSRELDFWDVEDNVNVFISVRAHPAIPLSDDV